MCYNPRSIQNPTTDFNPRFDRIQFQVPCGKCGECLKQKQREWYTRAYAEWNRCRALGGDTVMITLTYRPEDLPIVHNFDCFNRKHIQNFMKRLRINMSRGCTLIYKDKHGKPLHDKYGNVLSEKLEGGFDVSGLRYIICSEYASDPRYTQRPHYHGNLHIPFKIHPGLLKKYLNASWDFGYVSYSKKFGAIVSSPSGCKYVMKYVTKDMVFYKNEKLSKLLKSDVAFFADMKPHLPFHLQSKGYGEDLVNYLTEDEKKRGRFYLDAKDTVEYTIPQYISRKLFYIYNSFDKTWKLSEYGKQIMSERLNNRVKECREQYAKYFDWTYVDSVLTADQKHKLYFDFIHQDLNDCKSICDYLKYLLGERTVDLLTAYSLCYKDVPIVSFDYSIKNIDIETEYGHEESGFLEMSDNMLSERLNKVSNIPWERSYFKLFQHHYQGYKSHLYNHLPLFQGFDTILRIITKIKKLQGQNRQRFFDETSYKNRETKDFYYYNLYE